MFVGLMWWFAANVTIAPFFAWLTASAMWPTPIRSWDAKSARPSAGASRSPRSTLSATDERDGSLIRARSSWTGTGTALLLVSLDGARDVMPAETKAVAEHRTDFALLRGVRGVVEIELGIGR